MINSLQQPEVDITQEEYKGPSAAISTAGQGLIEHLLFAAAGLLIGGTLGLIFKEPNKKLIEWSRGHATKLLESAAAITEKKSIFETIGAGFQKGLGKTINCIVGTGELPRDEFSAIPKESPHYSWSRNARMNRARGFGSGFLSHTLGLIPGVNKWFATVADDRVANAVTAGGILGIVGYVGGWVKALLNGPKNHNHGKDQVERLQREILGLRAMQADQASDNQADKVDASLANTPPNATAVMGEIASGQSVSHGAHHEHTLHAHAAHGAQPHAAQSTIDAGSAAHVGMQHATAQHEASHTPA